VRAETCEQCHGHRKILYQEKDPSVEPVADDLASLNLDCCSAKAAIIA
jgi:FdhE protein